MDRGVVAKRLLLLIWTGILVGAICLIIKSKSVFAFDFVTFPVQKWSVGILQNMEYVYEYNKFPYLSGLLRGWGLKEAVEYDEEPESIAISFQEGDTEEIPYELSDAFPVISGETYYEEDTEDEEESEETLAKGNLEKIATLKQTKSAEYLIKNFYVVDATTSADLSVFNVQKMLDEDFSIQKKKKPQILIYHTHGGTESFSDSEPGNSEESIVGVGGYLAKLLRNTYGYEVIHDETEYDMVNGAADRNKAYNQAAEGIKKQLKENPSLVVLIDLHRDGVAGKSKKLTTINGKKTAQIMLFNGLSRSKTGPITDLQNDNLLDNLSFSLQLKLAAMEKYPGFTTPNYLKGYRYNLHLAKRSLLIELGNQNNTLEEAKNAMEPLADILNQVLE